MRSIHQSSKAIQHGKDKGSPFRTAQASSAYCMKLSCSSLQLNFSDLKGFDTDLRDHDVRRSALPELNPSDAIVVVGYILLSLVLFLQFCFNVVSKFRASVFTA
jgi:hypothetical protein